jgi:NAD(P)-dependent dehydrogenase (short-subunit alcohol dehydrogenase family)
MTVPGRPVAIVVGGMRSFGWISAVMLSGWCEAVIVHPGVAVGDDDDPRIAALRVVDQIRDTGGVAEIDESDLRTFAGAKALVDHAEERFGPAGILVNDVSKIHDVSDHDHGDWVELEFMAHVKSTTGLLRAALAPMASRGGGRIVNIARAFERSGPPEWSACLAAQSAVAGLTNCVASEGASRGIVANLVRGPDLADQRNDVTESVVALAVHLATSQGLEVTARCLQAGEVDDGVRFVDKAAEALDLCPMGAWGIDDIARAFESQRR